MATTMQTTVERLLYWTPRGLGLLFAAFVSVFALDVFGEGYTSWQTILALTMHMIPTALVLGCVALAWRWGWVGGIVFVGLAALHVVFKWGMLHWVAYLAIDGPLLLLGLLFVIDWWYARIRTTSGSRSAS
jgi:hypothetical protein